MPSRPTIVVLAAGQGRRFGGAEPKLVQTLGAGTVLGNTLRHAFETGWPVAVVTTAALAPTVQAWIATRDLVVLTAEEAARGMGHSIAAGVAAHADADGWLVLPGDMPLLRPESMLAVGRALDEHPVAYAQHLGRRGHPVGFSAELFSELIELSGDEGARRLLARYPAFGVDVDDAGVLFDVDTAEDLALARERAASG
ncbi:MAG: nucleotidyltransferase family protein [Rubrivivax sp.]